LIFGPYDIQTYAYYFLKKIPLFFIFKPLNVILLRFCKNARVMIVTIAFEAVAPKRIYFLIDQKGASFEQEKSSNANNDKSVLLWN
jgi:hypothetical protein